MAEEFDEALANEIDQIEVDSIFGDPEKPIYDEDFCMSITVGAANAECHCEHEHGSFKYFTLVFFDANGNKQMARFDADSPMGQCFLSGNLAEQVRDLLDSLPE